MNWAADTAIRHCKTACKIACKIVWITEKLSTINPQNVNNYTQNVEKWRIYMWINHFQNGGNCS